MLLQACGDTKPAARATLASKAFSSPSPLCAQQVLSQRGETGSPYRWWCPVNGQHSECVVPQSPSAHGSALQAGRGTPCHPCRAVTRGTHRCTSAPPVSNAGPTALRHLRVLPSLQLLPNAGQQGTKEPCIGGTAVMRWPFPVSLILQTSSWLGMVIGHLVAGAQHATAQHMPCQ